MTAERFIIISISIFSISSFFYIKKTDIRKAFVSLLAFQATTWLLTIILVQKGMIAFPERLFIRASQVNFIPQFLFFPTIFAWFILLFPQKSSFLKKLVHYILFISIPVWFVYYTTVYANIEQFLKGTPYSQVIRLYKGFIVQFLLCHIYIKWFFKSDLPARELK